MKQSNTSMQTFFSGEKLYGDNFKANEIEQWYAQEAEGYAELGAKDKNNYNYPYHTINIQNAYQHLDEKYQNLNVLSVGGAYGHELLPIIDRISSITILEPSQALRQADLNGIPIKYVNPEVDGTIRLEDNTFNLITCFGVLHHIPNVSFVLSEIFRVLRPDGMFIVREPTVSMGDWRKPRVGLTSNERGLPMPWFKNALIKAGFELERETQCFAKPFDKIYNKITGKYAIDNKYFIKFDRTISSFLKPLYRYHANNSIQKLRPTAVYFLAKKL